jgi:hypothetical protein
LFSRWTAQACDGPQTILFSSRGIKCFVLTQTKMLQSIHFDLVGKKHRTNDILNDIEMRDFTLSHSEVIRNKRLTSLPDVVFLPDDVKR